MKKIIAYFGLIVIATMTTACSPIYKTEYSYEPPHNPVGKMCTAQCIQAKNSCQQMCESKTENCKLRAHQDALAQFEMYKQEQKRTGKEVSRSVDSFDNSYSCSSDCGCEETHNACYTNCGGKVIEQQVCVAFCNKA